MANDFEDLSEALRREVLGEMAETFFGERKHVDDLTERITALAKEVRLRANEVRVTGGGVHFLLLSEPEVIRAFYEVLGVPPEPYLAAIECCGDEPFPEVEGGFALTRGGRYVKLVLAAYERYQHTLDAYRNGRVYDDAAQPGRKRLTPHLVQVKEMTKALNERIATLNNAQSPADVLCFIRTMDPEETERRKITGATLEGYEACLNRDMAIPELDFATLDLPDLPELPPLATAAKPLTAFLEDLYARDKARVAELLTRIANLD